MAKSSDDVLGLTCPECGSKKVPVSQSWQSDEFGGCYRRRRKCSDCGELFHTAEMDVVVLESEGIQRKE